MNADVNGDWREESASTILKEDPTYFTSFSCVVATDLDEDTLLPLAALLWESKIPLLVGRAYGMIGSLRLVAEEHYVLEAHPDTPLSDMRLMQPFPTLVEFCNTVDLDALSDVDHAHVPFAVVLFKFLEAWRAAHGGNGPANFREKQEFKETVTAGIRMRSDPGNEGVPLDEENFGEAVTAANTALNVPTIPDNVGRIFAKATPLNESSSTFWIMINALKSFVDAHNVLPLRGSVPDMVSDSDSYIALQTVYVEKAKADFSAIRATVQETLVSLGRDAGEISEFELKTFCKNASFLELVQTRSLADERASTDAAQDQYGTATFEGWVLECEEDHLWYVLLRAVDVFKGQHGHYPGEFTMEEDVPKLKECVSNVLEAEQWSKGQSIKDDYIQEMCRFGASKLHTVSSFLGGTAAQEVIKMLTHQYVPINSFYLYNGAKGTAVTLSV